MNEKYVVMVLNIVDNFPDVIRIEHFDNFSQAWSFHDIDTHVKDYRKLIFRIDENGKLREITKGYANI